MDEMISKKDAIKFLSIEEKEFDNYHKKSEELEGEKISGRWYFKKEKLTKWNDLKRSRTVNLSKIEYEKCFEFAIKMVYGGLSLNGIRGQRTEVQAADDVILGILAEHGIKRFLRENFNFEIELDEGVHPEEITPQDFHKITENGVTRDPKIGVGVKASKIKNAYLVLGENEVELEERSSDVYIFARVNLPSDHLFRILRDHSFFKKVNEFMEGSDKFKKIGVLEDIPIWICGFVYKDELDKVTSIPGQEFTSGYRYVKSVKFLRNSKEEWTDLLKKL
jgi:hypothetical protein